MKLIFTTNDFENDFQFLSSKKTRIYYDFTTNDDRDMRIYAEFCRFRPILSKWV